MSQLQLQQSFFSIIIRYLANDISENISKVIMNNLKDDQWNCRAVGNETRSGLMFSILIESKFTNKVEFIKCFQNTNDSHYLIISIQ